MKTVIAGLFALCVFSVSASAEYRGANLGWSGSYSFKGATDRQVDLNTAIANKQAAAGTLGVPGSIINQYNVGTWISDIENGSGNLNLDADQDATIGSQDNGATSIGVKDGTLNVNP